MRKTIGILGGMGPEATAYFFGLIIKHSDAVKDQDHIPVLIYNLPQIPERTPAILGKGPSPVPMLRKGVRTLAKAGADFIVIPCVSAHAFLPDVRRTSPVPILSLLDEALAGATKRSRGLKRAGLIASTGTVRSGMFARTFAKAGIEIITPTDREQAKVMEAVFGRRGVKAGYTEGRPRKLVLDAARRLIKRGAQVIIAGCTEIPLVLKDEDMPVPLIEPMRMAARAAVVKAGCRLRKGAAVPKS
jgi:aspartate racemase